MTTFADLSRPLALLHLLAADHPTLPAVDVLVTPLFPDLLKLSVHHDLDAFEAWREALGIDPDTIDRHVQVGGATVVLTAETTVADARVELTSYSQHLTVVKAVA